MKIEFIILGIFGIGFLSLGLYLLFNSLLTLVFGSASHKWPTTKGFIVASELKTGRLRSGAQAYWASLSYKYKINEHEYRGSRVGFSKYGVASNNSTEIEVPQAILAQYPQDAEVDVYYFPLMPALSTLEPGFRLIGFAGHFLLGSMFTACVIYLGLELL